MFGKASQPGRRQVSNVLTASERRQSNLVLLWAAEESWGRDAPPAVPHSRTVGEAQFQLKWVASLFPRMSVNSRCHGQQLSLQVSGEACRFSE